MEKYARLRNLHGTVVSTLGQDRLPFSPEEEKVWDSGGNQQ